MFRDLTDGWRWMQLGRKLKRNVGVAMDLGDKQAHKSMTALGVVMVAAYTALEQYQGQLNSVIPEPWNQLVPMVIGILGVVLTGLGLRRAVGNMK